MFVVGNLLRFEPFVFSNGKKPKPKYFIVLAELEAEVMLASLPSSQDHIPTHITKIHGCLDSPKDNVNCYYFSLNKAICTNGFIFPLETYVYGEQVGTANKQSIRETHPGLNGISLCGKLNDDEFSTLIDCLKKSTSMKRGLKRLL